jgi:hypothetical protein
LLLAAKASPATSSTRKLQARAAPHLELFAHLEAATLTRDTLLLCASILWCMALSAALLFLIFA